MAGEDGEGGGCAETMAIVCSASSGLSIAIDDVVLAALLIMLSSCLVLSGICS